MRASMLAALVAVPVLLVGACGSDSAEPTSSPSAPATSAESGGDTFTTDGVTVTGAPDSEPTITIDTAATPPAELVVEEISPGSGKAVGPNSQVTVQYTGAAWSTGQVFDSSWASGEPVTFPIQGVIAGWQQGLQGVEEGARVLLIIPPDQGYGDTPPPGSGIGIDDTLVFVVDVEKVQS